MNDQSASQSEHTRAANISDGTTIALIVAAGRGHRFGHELPKQYYNLAGVPLLRHTLRCFSEHEKIDFIRPVIHLDDQELFENASRGIKTLPAVFGGDSRQMSVCNGLESLLALNPGRVLIHDAARPFVSFELIDRVLEALDNHSAVLPALAVTDTLKSSANGMVTGTVDREGLWAAQTPQGFKFKTILDLHRAFKNQQMTDDVGLAEHGHMPVKIVEGVEMNTKITTKNDLIMANHLLASTETRIGQGFDVHRFCPGNEVMLCGVAVPHDHGLEGHSDADVALHALTDAVLGAAGLGDIGLFFPPSDDQWKGASSDIFLRHAADQVKKSGARIVNVDVTLICERPKLTPYRQQMVEKISEILSIATKRVNIKATTTERLGFTGRKEGIAAQAVASLAYKNK